MRNLIIKWKEVVEMLPSFRFRSKFNRKIKIIGYAEF